jgi:bifunctional UDP-N-acetylglucosamine pyrophosphorylase/glucosamine-1-phosphate N-acetyltransferase
MRLELAPNSTSDRRAFARLWNPKANAGKARGMNPETPPPSRPLAIIVLAAGKGTRMKSNLHKVLHPIAGRPMIDHLLASAAQLAPARQVVVVGSGREQLEAALGGRAEIVVQDPQEGTGHAVRQAEAALAEFEGDVLILYGDVPFVSAATMRAMLGRLHGPDAPPTVVLAFRAADPGAYGRVISEDGRTIAKMVEFKDASRAERQIDLCNSGLLAARKGDLFALLARVTADNAAKEYYLPDAVGIALRDGRVSALVETAEHEVTGINSRAELAAAEAVWQNARRDEAMAEGTSLRAPDTVFFSWDTKLGRDVTVEPNVVFGPGVTVADGARIRAFSHLEGATVGEGCEVGPFARLRPGAVLMKGAKVGNFVEVKATTMGEGAKASHLTYLGDATVGAGANIGAGTITCNYDGYFKHKTVIGERAFIGSNSALIAPVKIGADAIVAAGSAVSRDVADGELRMVRAEQLVKPGWADRFHDAMKRKKAERS